MPRCGVVADLSADAFAQRVVECNAIAQAHEQDHPLIALPVLADADAFQHFRQLFDLAIDFRSADAHAAGIEGGVGAPVDDHAIVCGQHRVVAVAPHARLALEICGAIFAAVGIIPERNRHRRKWRGAGEFAGLFAHRLARLVEDFHSHAEATALQFATPHRAYRTTEREARNDVGAAGNRGQQHAFLHIAIDVIETFRHQRRAGRQNGPERRQLVRFARTHAGLFGCANPLRAGAEHADAEFVDKIPQRIRIRMHGRAVVQHHGGTDREAGYQPVPHHPAAGGVEENTVVALQVRVQHQFFQVLDQRAAGTMHDALGNTGGARGIHDVERMIEWHGDELRLRAFERLHEIRQQHGVAQTGERGRRRQIGHHHQFADAVDAIEHAANFFQRVKALAAVGVAVSA